jgi:phage gp29-like protein
MLRSMAMLYLARQWAFRDRSRHSERHGMPFLQLITPAESDERTKDTARRAIAALGTETVTVTPQGETGNMFDWKMIEPKANSHETFSSQIDHLDKCIAILALGQAMSTEGVSGLGSQAKAGDTVRRDIMRFDALCLRNIGKDVIGDWTEFNFGSRDLTPVPFYEIDPPEDGLKKAQELLALGQALDILSKYGADTRAILEETGIPMLSEEDFAEQQAEAEESQQEDNSEDETDEADADAKEDEADTAKLLMTVTKKIVKRHDGWHVLSEDGGKHLGGPYKSRAQAVRRLRQIEYFKRKSNGDSAYTPLLVDGEVHS